MKTHMSHMPAGTHLWLKLRIQRIRNRKEDAYSYGKACRRGCIVYAYAGQHLILDEPHTRIERLFVKGILRRSLTHDW
jgi:ABC-type lipopolysaccharide export system ATPase subunit